MKIILIILFIFTHTICGVAQNSNIINGSISVPSLLSLKVLPQINGVIDFSTVADFTNGKEFISYFGIDTKATIPWTLTVSSGADFFNSLSNQETDQISSKIISIKESTTSNYIYLLSKEQLLIANKNENIENHFSIDLKVNPSWTSNAGLYNCQIIFTLSAQ